MHFYMHKRVPPFGLYVEKIVNIKFFGNFKQKSPKWPTKDLSDIERNKFMKNQPVLGIPQGLAYDNQPGGVDLTPPPCRIGLTVFLIVNQEGKTIFMATFDVVWMMLSLDLSMHAFIK